MNIPLVDLKAQYVSIHKELDATVAAVVKEAAFIGGPFLKAFEQEFAAYCGTRYALGVSSGTDALRVALHACGVGQGDEVITVPNTFIATTEAISMVGARVRFVDVVPNSLTMCEALLESALTDRTRAIIPVHLYGRPAEMDPILAFAKRHNLKVVADAAQAHGAVYKGRKIGALGDAVCFSFYPGKNLGAYGDAGAVVTDDPVIAERVYLLRDHGRRSKYEHAIQGFNCRMDGIQAAVLSVKLRHLDEWTERRREHAALYGQLLRSTPGLVVPEDRDDLRSVYHLYVIRMENRAKVQDLLAQKGVASGIHYPVPLHLQPAYAFLGLPVGSFPVAEEQANRILSLPMYPELEDEQIRYVVKHVQEEVRSA